MAWLQQLSVTNAIFGIFAFLTLGAIIYALYNRGGGLLDSLQNLDIARGLITFLVVFTTVVISLTLVLYVATSTASADDLKTRFGFGKEILTALIGILGTILGFYFGQSKTASDALQVAPVYLSNENPKGGDSIVLYSFVSGGKPPYTYSISFSLDNITAVPEKASAKGVIKEDVKTPAVTKDTEVTFKIAIKDSNGKPVAYDGKFTVKP